MSLLHCTRASKGLTKLGRNLLIFMDVRRHYNSIPVGYDKLKNKSVKMKKNPCQRVSAFTTYFQVPLLKKSLEMMLLITINCTVGCWFSTDVMLSKYIEAILLSLSVTNEIFAFFRLFCRSTHFPAEGNMKSETI